MDTDLVYIVGIGWAIVTGTIAVFSYAMGCAKGFDEGAKSVKRSQEQTDQLVTNSVELAAKVYAKANLNQVADIVADKIYKKAQEVAEDQQKVIRG